jgi:Tol biopolymer transport system component
MTQKIVCLSALTLLLGFVSVFAQKATPYFTEPSLSPDRREIAFVSGGDVWTASAEGGTAQLLVSHPATESRPLFSPDGKRLAFVSTAREAAIYTF